MIALSVPWYGALALVVLTVGFVTLTAAWVVVWLKEPSWTGTVPVLLCLAALAVLGAGIANLLGIAIPIPKISTAWWLIMGGLAATAFTISTWIHRDDPNVSITIGRYREAPVGLRELMLLLGIAFGVAMTWYGIGGLTDHEYVRSWLAFSSKATKLMLGASLVLSLFMFLASIVFVLDELVSELRKPPDAPRHVLARVARVLPVPVFLGVVLVVNWWLRF